MDPLTTALLAAISAAAASVAGGIGEAAGGEAWAAAKAKLAGWARPDKRGHAQAFERAVQAALARVRPGADDVVGKQALLLLTEDTPESRDFRQAAAEELLFSARPNLGRLVDSYRHNVRFAAALEHRALPAWGEIEPRVLLFIQALRAELYEYAVLRPLMLEQDELEMVDAARSTAGAAAASAASLGRIEALLHELAHLPRIAPVISAGDGASISNAPLTVVLGDQHTYAVPAMSPPDLEALYGRYCAFLASAFGVLDFRGIVQMQNVVKLRLVEIYIPLRGSRPAPPGRRSLTEDDDEGEEPPRGAAARRPDKGRPRAGASGARDGSAEAALHDLVRDHAFLVVLGDPGAGKSTLVRMLMLALAEGRAATFGLGDEWLPIFFPVAAFAEKRGRGDLAPLDYLRDYYHGRSQPDFTPLFERALLAGRALVLMDGLDEVREDRLAITRSLEDFIRRWDVPGNRFLATSRIAGYEDAPLDDALFARTVVRAFDDGEIRHFANKWSQAFERAGAPEQSADDPALRRRASRRAAELTSAVFANANVTALARNPLLLTILALIHNQGTRLPDRRVELYRLCVEALAETWNRARGLAGREIEVYLGDEKIDEGFVVNLLGPAALWIHEQSPGGLVEERDLARKLAEVLAETDGMPQGKARRLAEEFIQLVNRETGLLQERGHRLYGFLHLTFEEYLAARALLESSTVRDPDAEIHRRAVDPGWREVLRLALSSATQREAPRLLLHLLQAPTDAQTHGRPIVLAGECLQDLGRNRATQRAWRAVIEALLSLLGARAIPTTTRVEAGHVLGRLGDPRLLDLATGEATGYGDYPDVPSYWCDVEAGPFWFGDERVKDRQGKAQPGEDGLPLLDSAKLKQIELPYAFQVARYPVTNAEFAAFLAANGPEGYDPERPWWTEQGKVFLRPGGHRYDGQGEHVRLPRYWSNPQLNSLAQPVVGVSWYEAAAYCRWLSGIGHAKGWLPHDHVIRLPTSLEWERVARHRDKRPFPWGDTPPAPDLANAKPAGIGASSPVGCFPGDTAACGALDVAGNVTEWTSSAYGRVEALEPEGDFALGQGVDNRGGTWGGGIEWMRCGAPSEYYANDGHAGMGFRVVRSRAPLDEGL